MLLRHFVMNCLKIFAWCLEKLWLNGHEPLSEHWMMNVDVELEWRKWRMMCEIRIMVMNCEWNKWCMLNFVTCNFNSKQSSCLCFPILLNWPFWQFNDQNDWWNSISLEAHFISQRTYPNQATQIVLVQRNHKPISQSKVCSLNLKRLYLQAPKASCMTSHKRTRLWPCPDHN